MIEVSWKVVACKQGQKRMAKETVDEFQARVIALYRKRRDNKQVQEWRKDSGK